MIFGEMKICKKTAEALGEMGYIDATEVQEKTVPLILNGDEVVVRSQTGTGKTAAFGIGMIENISKDRDRKGLVLAPTRELAVQIANEIRSIAKNHRMNIYAIYGGAGMGPQIASLRRGFDIIVATPGRLLDHVGRGTVDLSSVNCVVLDEADRMLDMGFKPDIDRILRQVNAKRQMMLFSATLEPEILRIIGQYMRAPHMIEVGPQGKAVKIDEESIKLSRSEKLDRLSQILASEPVSRTIVFVASKRAVETICRKLNRNGIEAKYLHGGKSQTQRERTIREFQEGRFRILIATDVAARGLHVEDISHVINYDQADSPEMHTHRIGRTGRMGKAGRAITFVETDPLPRGPRGGRRNNGGYSGNGRTEQRSHGGRHSSGHSSNSRAGQRRRGGGPSSGGQRGRGRSRRR
ncbi:MAG: DEAD/DEAH box helicase [Candidatus Micrarchaeota archaeon]